MNLWDYEVSFERIFNEILSAMNISMKDIEQVKNHFYLYFRRDCTLFFEVEETLKNFSDKGMCLRAFCNNRAGNTPTEEKSKEQDKSLWFS